ncbi:MAG: hypothetical protein ACE366_19985 [Bradymonadia bacterium]
MKLLSPSSLRRAVPLSGSIPLVALLLLTGQWGCGATCGEIKTSLQRFDRQRARTPDPHIELQVAMDPINAHLEGMQKLIVPLTVPLPSEGNPDAQLSLSLTDVSMVPVASGALSFDVEIQAAHDGQRVFTLSGRAEIPPVIEGQRLVFALRPEQLRTLQLDLSPQANLRVADLLWRLLPEEARRLTPKPLFLLASKAAVEALIEHTYPLVRDGILSHLDAVTEVSMALPPVPLKDMKVVGIPADHLGGDRLRIQLYTDLPVARGLHETPKDPMPPLPRDGVHVRVAGEALAAMANWAMVNDHLPARFTGDGEADPEGPWRTRVTWARQRSDPDQPPGFDLHLWRLDRGCARVKMSSVARLSLTDTEKAGTPQGLRLEGRVEDGEIVEVEGEALVEALIWLNSIWREATAFTGSVAARTDFVLGDYRWKASLTEAQLKRSEVQLQLRVQGASPSPVPPSRLSYRWP